MTDLTVTLGYAPRRWQAEARARLRRFSVLVVHARAGKTTFADQLLTDSAIRTLKPRSQYAYLAPFLKQAKRNSWAFLKNYALRIPGAVAHEGDLTVTFPNESKIMMLGADDPDALRGLYLDGIVLDELAQMKPETWGEVIYPRLVDRHGWALFIGTSKGLNLLSELYHKAVRQNDAPAAEWVGLMYTVMDTGVFTPEIIAKMRENMTDAQFRQEMLNDFTAESDSQLIPMDVVLRASGKHLRDEDYSSAAKVLGVDVARFGGDRSVIFRRQGLASFHPKIYRSIDNMSLAAEVAREIDEWGADACFVDAGRGEGVIDRLRQLNYSPLGVDFGGKASSPHFINRKAEMWSAMRDWLESGAALPNNEELKADLCTPTYSYSKADSRMQMESKDELRARGMRSPDLADALALTFAFPVAPRENPMARHSSRPQVAVMEDAPPWLGR